MNHGPGTSLYYVDPDRNQVELSGPNFDDEAEYFAYFDSEAYCTNISGVDIDPEEDVARFRHGIPQGDLVRIAEAVKADLTPLGRSGCGRTTTLRMIVGPTFIQYAA